MWLLYNIFSFLIYIGIFLISPFNHKARLWFKGRKGWKRRFIPVFRKDQKIIWIHCSSLGEFEQGRPVIEELKSNIKGVKIILTFFSPSGYEVRKDYSFADMVCYLPADILGNARIFLNRLRPDLAIFVKYEFWYNYLRLLKKRDIPVFLISASFKPNQIFFKWYGKWYLRWLYFFKRILVQDEFSAKWLKKHQVNHVRMVGDTRFDRVAAVAEKPLSISTIESFSKDRLVIVAGSTWENDEKLLIPYILEFGSEYRWIIVPHEISKYHIDQLIYKLNGQVALFSSFNVNAPAEYNVLIVDKIGFLTSVYQYAHIAYVGGGFGKGIHNILEPAVYGIPVIFGPRYHQFNEATDLIKAGGGFGIRNYSELKEFLDRFLHDKMAREQAGIVAYRYVKTNEGAKDIVMEEINKIFRTGNNEGFI